jgi:hypothetical protein
MIWTLSICFGITWAGCAGWINTEYPSEESCYRALAAIRVNDSPMAESDKKRSMVATCGPKKKEAK